MQLLYSDESNLESRAGDFFVYGGVIVPGDAAKSLSAEIDAVRLKAKISHTLALKFNPCPQGLSHTEFIQLKSKIIKIAAEHGCKFLVSLILHNVASSPDTARRNEINRLVFHFDCYLRRSNKAGLVLIDRFTDVQIDDHLREKFCVGVTGLPYSSKKRLENIVGFHYSAVGQSHFPSLIDIVLGSFRYCVNAISRNDQGRLRSVPSIFETIEPLFYRERRGLVSELSLFFSPKIIKVATYREKYEKLKGALAAADISTSQPITGIRRY